MKTFVWIAGSFFVILFGFIIGIFLAPLLAYLTGFPVFVIPVIIAGLSMIAFIVLHFEYKKAQRAIKNSSFYYPGLLVPIFLCSGLLAIHSYVKFEDSTYDRHGIINNYRSYYNSFGIELFEDGGFRSSYFYAYNEYGDVFICCWDRYDRDVRYKIYTLDGTLVQSGDIDFDESEGIRNDIAKSMNLIPEY